MFKIELLPAQQGDAIWIEYGSPKAPHRVLIDAGTPPTAAAVRERLEKLPVAQRHFDLLVVTHVDTDHIGGILKLLSKLPAGVQFDDVWFNGWPQIRTARSSLMGPVDGEILSTALKKLGWSWNSAFGGKAAMANVTGAAVGKPLRGGLQLTVLSPEEPQLAKLRAEWKRLVHDAGLDPADRDGWKALLEAAARKGVKSSILGEPDVTTLAKSKFEPDNTPANGSSIALLAEYDGKRALLAADAYAPVLHRAVTGVCKARKLTKLKVDAFKLPHHGSSGNVSIDLLALVPSRHYVFSTNGAIFGHPDDEAWARVVATSTPWRKTLHFNYPAVTIAANYKKKKKHDAPDWGKPKLQRDYKYDVTFPPNDRTGIRLEL